MAQLDERDLPQKGDDIVVKICDGEYDLRFRIESVSPKYDKYVMSVVGVTKASAKEDKDADQPSLF